MPETPTPAVNGHVTSLRLLHASRSISSFTPAAAIEGTAGFTATAGSFCLFCGKGVVGLPTVTRVSLVYGVAPASAATARTVTGGMPPPVNQFPIPLPFPGDKRGGA